MSRFLITTWHPPGHLYPQIAIAEALRKRGHEVAFYSGEQTRKVLSAEGFQLFPFQAVNEAAVDRALFGQNRHSSKPTSGKDFAKQLQSWIVETIPAQVADIERVLHDWQPDALTSDQTMWGGTFILGELGRIPAAITSCGACCMIPGRDAPPFGLGLPKPTTFRTRLASNAVVLAQRFVARGFRNRLNEIRGSFGLPAITTLALSHLGTVPLYILPSTPEFDYDRHDLPASVRYVGPYLWNKPATILPPPWFETLRTDRPWIHATEGTIHVGEPLVLRATAQGLADRDYEVILTSGGARDPETINLGTNAANVHLARWIAHSDLLSKTAVIITTGGAGTVLASIDSEVPMIMIPTEWDKPELAQRIVAAGAGIRIMPNRVTPTAIRSAVERILAHSTYKQGVQRLKTSFQRYGGADYAALLLEQLLAASKPRIEPVPPAEARSVEIK